MPRISNNPTHESRRGEEYELGTLPPGSAFATFNCRTDELVVMGYVLEQWQGVTWVTLTNEGDGNFIGKYEDETLGRILKMGNGYMQHGTPVVWLGVDEDVVTALTAEVDSFVEAENKVAGTSLPSMVSLTTFDQNDGDGDTTPDGGPGE